MNEKEQDKELTMQVDSSQILERAVSVFAEQAGVGSSKKVTLTDIEISKAKANNFMDALSNMRNIKHELDIVSSTDASFKRKDELDVLNALRESCKEQANISLRASKMLNSKLEGLIREFEARKDQGLGEEVDQVEMMSVQTMLDVSVGITSKIIASSAKLIELERKSGGRQWGVRESGSSNSIRYISELEGKQGEDSRDSGDIDHLSEEIQSLYKRGLVRKIGLEDLS